MKKLIYMAFLLMPLAGFSQNFSEVFSQIEKNNTTLKALREEMNAAVTAAHTGNAPSDPEVDFGYLWGTPKDQGNRVDLDVTQTFDFPTAYVYRKRIADGVSDAARSQYDENRRQILLQANAACVEIVYRNMLSSVLYGCLYNAQGISDAWSRKAGEGDATALDVNKADLNLRKSRKAFDENEIEKEALLHELRRLNGGEDISVNSSEYMPVSFPSDFESWYASAQIPSIASLESESDVAQTDIRLQTSGWLPKFSIGYVSERIAGTTLQGVHAGISIPLWENHGKVRAAKASAEAAKARLEDSRLQMHDSLKILWEKGMKLQKVVSEYEAMLKETRSIDLLTKALDLGEISLLDYLMEQDLWIDALQDLLSSQRDLQLIAAELASYSK